MRAATTTVSADEPVTEPWDAVVVGSGPNGLAASITLALAGFEVLVIEAAPTLGGGLRSDELDGGLVRDRCAAVLPFAVGSPFLASLPLDQHGLGWAHPEVQFSHPLDARRAGVVYAALDETVAQLGTDGSAYQKLVGRHSLNWAELASDVLRPIAHVPRHPLIMARYGRTGVRSAQTLAARFGTEETRAIIAGCAAHSVLPLDAPFTGGVATLFCAAAHAEGWPVAVGGSQRLADALVSYAKQLGVSFQTRTPISSMTDLPPHRVVLFDVDPLQLEKIAGDNLPNRYRRRLRAFRFGPGIFKIDHVLDGPVPWADPYSHRAGTVHLGGTFEEVSDSEAQVAQGRHPDRPFVLVAQQSLIDPSRVTGGRQVLWSYTHVPNNSDVDMTAAIEQQIERFAPGFMDRVIARHTTTTAQLAAYNPNCVGGDISGGSSAGRQLLVRPTLLKPHRTPNPSILICSASTAPGGGVHGMAGHHAARAALSGALR